MTLPDKHFEKVKRYKVKDPEILQLISEIDDVYQRVRQLYFHLENYTDLFIKNPDHDSDKVEYPLSRVQTIRMACRRLPEIRYFLKLKDAEIQGVDIYG